ncbi:hypothetical protein SAMN05444411_101617 [Lutibacter oricola]|uniref:DUF6268 domain-containing protein n=1 Tax=Lutibacter oricola TaxID=762486 RepID=A0A1H2T424_9FLAO|nr:DUF6268 family outer membrane beta-barrel protein [Lutibacter oricola]SDW38631.1 hypothetical protein SAMN05444411_101617 [Lutibacter oricola]
MTNKILMILLLFSVVNVVGQDRNLFNIEIGGLPASSDAVSLKMVEAKLNIPVKLKTGVLINSLSFSSLKLDYEDYQLLNTDELEEFKAVSYSIGYMNRINEKWSYMVNFSPQIASNFEASLTLDDFNFNGGVIFTKTSSNSKLNLGLVINSGFGLAVPLPVISYSKQVNERFSYVLGMPVTKAEYKFNKRNKVSLFVKPKGFIANLSNNIQFENGLAKKARYTSIVSGLSFGHQIDDNWGINFNGGYQLYSNYSLQSNDRTELYDFNTSNGIYASVGLSFNLINNKKRKN